MIKSRQLQRHTNMFLDHHRQASSSVSFQLSHLHPGSAFDQILGCNIAPVSFSIPFSPYPRVLVSFSIAHLSFGQHLTKPIPKPVYLAPFVQLCPFINLIGPCPIPFSLQIEHPEYSSQGNFGRTNQALFGWLDVSLLFNDLPKIFFMPNLHYLTNYTKPLPPPFFSSQVKWQSNFH